MFWINTPNRDGNKLKHDSRRHTLQYFLYRPTPPMTNYPFKIEHRVALIKNTPASLIFLKPSSNCPADVEVPIKNFSRVIFSTRHYRMADRKLLWGQLVTIPWLILITQTSAQHAVVISVKLNAGHKYITYYINGWDVLPFTVISQDQHTDGTFTESHATANNK